MAGIKAHGCCERLLESAKNRPAFTPIHTILDKGILCQHPLKCTEANANDIFSRH